eukprot:gene16167-24765_t
MARPMPPPLYVGPTNKPKPDAALEPPSNPQEYASIAAATVAKALIELHIGQMHDLDIVITESVRMRCDNDPVSLPAIVLSHPRVAVCAQTNIGIRNARTFENHFVSAMHPSFPLREGVAWIQERFGVTEEQAIEGLELLNKRNAIASDASANTEEQLERRARKERETTLDKQRVYKVLREAPPGADDEEVLSMEEYLELLETAVSDDAFQNDDQNNVPKTALASTVDEAVFKCTDKSKEPSSRSAASLNEITNDNQEVTDDKEKQSQTVLCECLGVQFARKKMINVVVRFSYEEVETYRIDFPELEISYNTTIFDAFVHSEYVDLMEAISEGYSSATKQADPWKDGLQQMQMTKAHFQAA